MACVFRSSPLDHPGTQLASLLRQCADILTPEQIDDLLTSQRLLRKTPQPGVLQRLRKSFINFIGYIRTTEPDRTVQDLIQALRDLDLNNVALVLEEGIPEAPPYSVPISSTLASSSISVSSSSGSSSSNVIERGVLLVPLQAPAITRILPSQIRQILKKMVGQPWPNSFIYQPYFGEQAEAFGNRVGLVIAQPHPPSYSLTTLPLPGKPLADSVKNFSKSDHSKPQFPNVLVTTSSVPPDDQDLQNRLWDLCLRDLTSTFPTNPQTAFRLFRSTRDFCTFHTGFFGLWKEGKDFNRCLREGDLAVDSSVERRSSLYFCRQDISSDTAPRSLGGGIVALSFGSVIIISRDWPAFEEGSKVSIIRVHDENQLELCHGYYPTELSEVVRLYQKALHQEAESALYDWAFYLVSVRKELTYLNLATWFEIDAGVELHSYSCNSLQAVIRATSAWPDLVIESDKDHLIKDIQVTPRYISFPSLPSSHSNSMQLAGFPLLLSGEKEQLRSAGVFSAKDLLVRFHSEPETLAHISSLFKNLDHLGIWHLESGESFEANTLNNIFYINQFMLNPDPDYFERESENHDIISVTYSSRSREYPTISGSTPLFQTQIPERSIAFMQVFAITHSHVLLGLRFDQDLSYLPQHVCNWVQLQSIIEQKLENREFVLILSAQPGQELKLKELFAHIQFELASQWPLKNLKLRGIIADSNTVHLVSQPRKSVRRSIVASPLKPVIQKATLKEDTLRSLVFEIRGSNLISVDEISLEGLALSTHQLETFCHSKLKFRLFDPYVVLTREIQIRLHISKLPEKLIPLITVLSPAISSSMDYLKGHSSGSSRAALSTNFNSIVFDAAGGDQIDQLRNALTLFGHLIDTPYPNFQLTPLHLAALNGRVSAIELLIAKGSQAIDTSDSEGRTPIYLAATRGHAEVIETLVRLGTQALDTPDRGGTPPIFRAALNGDLTTIQVLVRSGCQIDSLNRFGRNPIHAAAEKGSVEAINTLARLAHEYPRQTRAFFNFLDAADVFGCTPSFRAYMLGQVAAIETLIRLGSKTIDTPDKDGLNILHHAAKNGSTTVVETLCRLRSHAVDTTDNEGKTPLIYAASNGHVNVIEILVQFGSQAINTPSKEGWTPMHFAANRGPILVTHEKGSEPAQKSSKDQIQASVIEKLASFGGAIDPINNEGRSPLFLALQKNFLRCVTVLKALGASCSISTEGFHDHMRQGLGMIVSEEEVAEIRSRVYFNRSMTQGLLYIL